MNSGICMFICMRCVCGVYDVYMWAEASGQCQTSCFVTLHFIPLRHGLSLNLELDLWPLCSRHVQYSQLVVWVLGPTTLRSLRCSASVLPHWDISSDLVFAFIALFLTSIKGTVSISTTYYLIFILYLVLCTCVRGGAYLHPLWPSL